MNAAAIKLNRVDFSCYLYLLLISIGSFLKREFLISFYQLIGYTIGHTLFFIVEFKITFLATIK